MKIKEMTKKIATFNEVAEMIGAEKAELRCSIGFGFSVDATYEKSFKKHIKNEYVDVMAKAILDYSDYEFGKEVEISVTDVFGDVLTERVIFWAN